MNNLHVSQVLQIFHSSQHNFCEHMWVGGGCWERPDSCGNVMHNCGANAGDGIIVSGGELHSRWRTSPVKTMQYFVYVIVLACLPAFYYKVTNQFVACDQTSCPWPSANSSFAVTSKLQTTVVAIQCPRKPTTPLTRSKLYNGSNKNSEFMTDMLLDLPNHHECRARYAAWSWSIPNGGFLLKF